MSRSRASHELSCIRHDFGRNVNRHDESLALDAGHVADEKSIAVLDKVGDLVLVEEQVANFALFAVFAKDERSLQLVEIIAADVFAELQHIAQMTLGIDQILELQGKNSERINRLDVVGLRLMQSTKFGARATASRRSATASGA